MTNEDLEHWTRDGFAVARGVLDPDELEPLRVACDAVASEVQPDDLRHRVVGACLLNDRLVAKPPGAPGYGLHQDHPYYLHVDVPSDVIAILVLAIDPADATNGAIELLAGYHPGPLPAPGDEPLDVDPIAVDDERSSLAEMNAGDVLVMHGYTPHQSAPNHSDAPRRSLQLVYNDARYGDRYERFQAERTYD